MTPHLFPSCLYPSWWACCAKRLSVSGSRVYKPLPAAAVVYGRTPAEAYKGWMEHFAMQREAGDVGSA